MELVCGLGICFFLKSHFQIIFSGNLVVTFKSIQIRYHRERSSQRSRSEDPKGYALSKGSAVNNLHQNRCSFGLKRERERNSQLKVLSQNKPDWQLNKKVITRRTVLTLKKQLVHLRFAFYYFKQLRSNDFQGHYLFKRAREREIS